VRPKSVSLQYLKSFTRLEDFRRAGGTTAKAALYGAWDEMPIDSRYSPYARTFWARLVQSNYNYRALPTYIEQHDPRDTSYNNDYIRLWYMRPHVIGKLKDLAGPPIFKTQRALGGRALAMDSFSKNMGQETAEPGVGAWAHREGYNTLYGDGHCAWYGDPQQQLVFWAHPNATNASAVKCFGTDTSVITAYKGISPSTINHTGTYFGTQYVMHLFDKAAGIDVNADE